jgi:DNA polymerase-3 subunit beta
MIGALKRSLVLDAHVNVTRMHFADNHLKIVTLDPDGGTMEQEIDIEYAGADMLVGCNAQYLSEVLEQITTDTAYMDLREPTSAGPSPMVIRPADDTDYLCVVMPVRLSTPDDSSAEDPDGNTP